MPVTVERWGSYMEAEERPQVLGGAGGWFGRCEPCHKEQLRHINEVYAGKGASVEAIPPCPHGHHPRWAEYVRVMELERSEHVVALRAAILERQLREGGDWHQSAEDGVPFFSDGTAATYSFRAWGDLLAAIWSEAENKDYGYMDFYMSRLVKREE